MPRRERWMWTWWALKGLGTLGLIACLAGLALGWAPPPLIAAPVVVGQALVALAVASNLAHYLLLKRRNPRLAAPGELVTRGGLLRWIRHPMYLGDLGIGLGLWLLLPALPGLVPLGAVVVGALGLAVVEDRLLAARFGPDFAAWRDRSGLLLPGIG